MIGTVTQIIAVLLLVALVSLSALPALSKFLILTFAAGIILIYRSISGTDTIYQEAQNWDSTIGEPGIPDE